jgi:type I restriction enzyme S subunit
MQMSEWRFETVEDCLAPLSLRGSTKIQARDYRPTGRFPIVDQGQALVAGWTDSDEGLISTDLPVVVFGDHTRTLKYIDFPFVRGADGTQILKPKSGIDALYFYYACRALDLPSRGYNRHFTLLKEKEIRIVPEGEQTGISQALKVVDEARSIQDTELQILEDCKRAAMQALFTRGLRGEPQKETEIGLMPKSWTPKSLLELCTILSGGTPRKSETRFWSGAIPWVSGKDLKVAALDDAIDHITDEGVKNGSRLAPADAVLLLVRGMGLAKDLPVAVINRPMAFNQDVKALVSRKELSGRFIRSAIYLGKDRLLSKIVPSAHGTMTLNLDDVETLKIPCPAEQAEANEIVAILDAIDRKIDLHRRKRTVLEDLFKALLHKLMTGELRVADLDLSALAEAGARGVAA